MMIIVNRIGDSITGSYNGKPFGVSFNEEKYGLMKAAEKAANSASSMEELKQLLADFEPLTQESYKELVETASPYIFVNKNTNKFFLHLGTRVSTRALPKAFVDRILNSVDKKIDVAPLVKAWIRFLRNPQYSDQKAQRFANYINKTYMDTKLRDQLLNSGLSNDVANERATSYQTPITQEGLLVTYKVSREVDWKYELDGDGNPVEKKRYAPSIDEITGLITYATPEYVEDRKFYPAVQGLDGGDDFACDGVFGHIIRVGAYHNLKDWSGVNTNDNQSCVKGLHCGNLDYIRGYQSEGTVTHNVFIDPMHIGAVTDDGSGALRVLGYFVYSSFAGVNKSIYHSSEYAKLTDKEYEGMLAEALKTLGENDAANQDAIKERASELQALI